MLSTRSKKYDKIIKIMMTFLDNFDLLEERDLNRKQFAEQSGVPYTTVIGWTNLNRLPDYSALIKIADFFHCSIDYLVGRQDSCNNVDSTISESEKSEKELLMGFRKLSGDDRRLILELTKSLLRKKDK